MDCQALSRGFPRSQDRFRPAYCFFVQLPRANGLLAAFSSQVRIQLALRFVERCFRRHAGEVSGIICFSHLLNKDSGLRVNRCRVGFSALPSARLSCQLLVGGLDVSAPARFHRPVQVVQGSIGSIGGFSHSALLKKPGEDRPVDRLRHECLGLFDFGKFSHSESKLAGGDGKVQRTLRRLWN